MSQDATSLITSQIAAAAACTYILNLIQRWKAVPWITAHTKGMTIVVRALLAAGATLGIQTAWSAGSNDTHILAITIPSTLTLIHGLWQWFSQYALTHLAGSALEKENKAVDQPYKIN